MSAVSLSLGVMGAANAAIAPMEDTPVEQPVEDAEQPADEAAPADGAEAEQPADEAPPAGGDEAEEPVDETPAAEEEETAPPAEEETTTPAEDETTTPTEDETTTPGSVDEREEVDIFVILNGPEEVEPGWNGIVQATVVNNFEVVARDVIVTILVPTPPLEALEWSSFDAPVKNCGISSDDHHTVMHCMLTEVKPGEEFHIRLDVRLPDFACDNKDSLKYSAWVSVFDESQIDINTTNNKSEREAVIHNPKCDDGNQAQDPVDGSTDGATGTDEPPAGTDGAKDPKAPASHAKGHPGHHGKQMPHTGADTTFIGTLAGCSMLAGALLIAMRRRRSA